MWYIELIIMAGIIALFTQSVIFVDFASEEQQVNNEAINLVSILMNVQERSRNYHYMKDSDFRPHCYIYRDKYTVKLNEDVVEEVYYLHDDIKIDFDDNANFYVFRQNSLYNSWPNKTIKIYSGNTAKYIVINRVGRIRIINSNIWQNLNKDENGFLHIELLILMAILSSVAMIYICMGILRNQQLNNGYRMTAIYLAQGYLNLMEEQKANMIPNQIECNGMKYMIKQNEFFQDDIDEISIEISWRYHDQEEMEYQEREIKREAIK